MLTVERMLTPLQVTHQVPGQDDKIFTIEDMEGGDDNKGYKRTDETEEKVLCLSWCCSASPLVTGAGQRGDHTGQSELVSPTKRTTTPHTTPPHQDGARHCLPPDHLDRLGSFLGH